MIDNISNTVTICGTVKCPPVFDHMLMGEKFYKFAMEVLRKSNQADIIPVTISEQLYDISLFNIGSVCEVHGQFRSYNNVLPSENRGRLLLSLFAKNVEFKENDEFEYINSITLQGYICKPVIYRVTPLGREISDILLAVNRQFNKSDYIPCIVWGQNANFANTLVVGDKVNLSGRIQSRDYTKIDDDGSSHERRAYEISVSQIKKMEDIT